MIRFGKHGQDRSWQKPGAEAFFQRKGGGAAESGSDEPVTDGETPDDV